MYIVPVELGIIEIAISWSSHCLGQEIPLKVTPVNFDFKLGNYTIHIEITASQLPSTDPESPHGRCRKRK